jgi:putative transcriptional regulator
METMASLRGQLLVAAPDLLDPNFRRTVVLVGEHGEEGAMGIVLNRPSDVTFDEAVPALAEIVDGDDLVHVGGPVQPQAIVVLGEFDEPDDAGVLVFGTVGFLPGEIDDATSVGELARTRVFAGYAGWGPGQLESELEESAWIVEPAEPADVFTLDPDDLWSAVLRRKGGPFTLLATMPLDPSVN